MANKLPGSCISGEVSGDDQGICAGAVQEQLRSVPAVEHAAAKGWRGPTKSNDLNRCMCTRNMGDMHAVQQIANSARVKEHMWRGPPKCNM